jgi:hypothetical protein
VARLSNAHPPPNAIILVEDRPVRLRALPPRAYFPLLRAYLRRTGLSRVNLLARAFVSTEEGATTITFRGNSWQDMRLGAHELGHVLRFKHPHEWPSWRLVFDGATWTTMHPSGLFRRTDPEGLVEQWRRLVPASWRHR